MEKGSKVKTKKNFHFWKRTIRADIWVFFRVRRAPMEFVKSFSKRLSHFFCHFSPGFPLVVRGLLCAHPSWLKRMIKAWKKASADACYVFAIQRKSRWWISSIDDDNSCRCHCRALCQRGISSFLNSWKVNPDHLVRKWWRIQDQNPRKANFIYY